MFERPIRILNWVLNNQVRHDQDYITGSWHGFDGTLIHRLGLAPIAPSVAELAKTVPLNQNAFAAPSGAIHFYDVQPYGHVAVEVCGGGSVLLESMPTGLQFISQIDMLNGRRYLGWHLFEEAFRG